VKYYLIANDVIGSIREGRLKFGMKVPSDNQIIREYRVSNTIACKVP
jgi:DNA-binding GntR family transcriptional regulator